MEKVAVTVLVVTMQTDEDQREFGDTSNCAEALLVVPTDVICSRRVSKMAMSVED